MPSALKKQEIIVPVGLPGSGKTMLYKEYEDEYTYCGVYEKEMVKIKGDKTKAKGVFLDLVTFLMQQSYKKFYVDGLFLSKEIQDELENFFDVKFIYFEPDIEACLHNDRLRQRRLTAERTIIRRKVNKPDNIFREIKIKKY